ncbi:MAG: hypothetical protein K2H87_01590 [Duncaniella sp.]|nr:hypothetical protein [Duncaniella sp.]
MGVMLSSCSKDDDKDEPKSDNELVGTWYYTSDGETDYDDYFIFRSNGTGTYHYDDAQSDDFTYTYDSKTKFLSLNFKHWDSERFVIEWLGNNLIDIDGYGEYMRK